MSKTPKFNTVSGAYIYSLAILRLYDWWVLTISNRFAWQCPTKSVLLPFFQKYLRRSHLDIGVGTGYYLARSALPHDQEITLLDLNGNSLKMARDRISSLNPCLVREDILNPGNQLEGRIGKSLHKGKNKS